MDPSLRAATRPVGPFLLAGLAALLALLVLPVAVDAPSSAASAAAVAPLDPGTPPAGVTGGSGRRSVVVTTLADAGPGSLRDALVSGGGHVTFAPGLVGSIELAHELRVPSDTTIDGAGAAVTLTRHPLTVMGVRNVVIRHLRFTGQVEAVSGDAVMVHSSTDVWIDHNSFSNAADGLVDVTALSTRVTLSWNRFESHRKTMLLGSASAAGTPTPVDITLHHNLLIGTSERNPMVRHGRFHIVNNVLDDWGFAVTGYGIRADCGADARIEGNILDPGANPRAIDVSTNDCDPTRMPAVTAVGNDVRGAGTVETTSAPSSLSQSTAPPPTPATAELEAAVRAGAGWGADAPLPSVPAPAGSVGLVPRLTRVDSSKIDVTWAAVPGASAYDLQMFSCGFGRLWYSEVASSTSVVVGSLPLGCYVARVRATGGTSPTGAWEGTPQLVLGTTTTTTAPTTSTTTVATGGPTPILQALSASSVRLSWTAVAGATNYRWQILTCAGAVISTSDTLATTKDRTGLLPGCYRGSVRAQVNGTYGVAALSNDVHLGTTSTTAPPATTTTTAPTTTTTAPPATTTTAPSTTTTIAAPSTTTTTKPASSQVLAPTLTSPRSGSLTVSWRAVTGATQYRWRILRCSGGVVTTSTTTATTKTVGGLGSGCYVAEVQAKRASGWSTWERTRSLTI